MRQSPLFLLLGTDLTLRTLAGTSVSVGALSTDREALAVTEATVAANIHQTLDVHVALTAQIALNHELGVVDVLTDCIDFVFRKILNTGVNIDVALIADLGGGSAADAVDVGQTDLNTLLARKVDTINTGQRWSPLLALTLLVARILADNENLAVASDDLALIAHLLDRRTYLHRSSSR